MGDAGGDGAVGGLGENCDWVEGVDFLCSLGKVVRDVVFHSDDEVGDGEVCGRFG